MLFGYIDPSAGFTIISFGGLVVAFLVSILGVLILFYKRLSKFLKNNKKIVIITTLIIAALLLTALGIGMINKENTFDNKIIILGFDGLSPQITESMMEDGKLPNFNYLKEKGAFRYLETTNPSQSPVAWTGFATGQNPGKTGVFDFIVRDPETYGLRLSISNMKGGKPQRVINSKCFWEYTSDESVPTIIIGCPITYPPDKVHGRMLSGMGVPDILGTEGTFTFYTSGEIKEDKETGGTVFPVSKSQIKVIDLIGPRVSHIGGKAKNVKVPAKIVINDTNSCTVEYQKKKYELAVREWSDWMEVEFKLGIFKKAKGIFKCYLVEIEPKFKLYVSPINFDPRAPLFAISHPKGYSKELVDKIGLYYTQGMPMDTWAVNQKRIDEKAFLEQVDEVIREKKAMLDLELDRFKKGVLFCYFESSDIIQHMFWRYIDPDHPLYEADSSKKYKEIITSWYKRMDDILGDVLEKTTVKDIIIVLSDHGFNTFRKAAHVNSWLRENGYLVFDEANTETGKELLSGVNWLKTKAFAIGFGAIYINLEGREKYGIVKPGLEAENLKEEISKKLMNWKDDKFDVPVISNVYEREEIFWGSYDDQTPDLYIGFNIGYRASWQTALGATPDILIEDNLKKWSGSHLFDPCLVPGILLCNKQETKEDVSIYDIAPSVLKIIGYSEEQLKECNFDGSALF
ncbi:MAG: alkaline phosphatase family protein [bacterium]|nr:MAG: alkaline phosphatase family protein [bacterium]